LSGLLGSGALEGLNLNVLSDIRYKTNMELIQAPVVNSLLNAKVYKFDYKRADGTAMCGEDSRQNIGFIAQELELLNENLVKEVDGKKYIDYAAITALNTQMNQSNWNQIQEIKRFLQPNPTAK